MVDKTGACLGISEVCILSAYLFLYSQALLFALVAIALAHLAYAFLGKRPSINWLAAYSAALSEKYSATGSLVHSIAGANSQIGRNTFKELPRRYLLGDEKPQANGEPEKMARSLKEILSFGMRSGKSINSSLSEFRKRVTNEINLSNLISSKTGAMKSVTYAGLIVFLPLFGGVSSNILPSVSQAYTLASLHSFLYAILVYILAALFITSYAYEQDTGIFSRIINLLPLFSISSFVLFFTSTYISYLI